MPPQAGRFTTIQSEGALLPPDVLRRVENLDGDLGGLSPDAYHLAPGERLNEAINRSWNRLLGAWKNFRDALEKLPEGDHATTPTRDRWLLPLFQELGYGRLAAVATAREIEGKRYPISHSWGAVPIHLVGCRVPIDRRTPGVRGAAGANPHSLLQEFLNRADDCLWGFVSNGLRLRLLRDNLSLTRQAYVEFDLESMMEGEVYTDFSLLWLVCHQSRLEATKPEETLLERWSRAAREEGARVLDGLRDGVERAIEALGRGFLAHPANTAVREKLRAGSLSTQDYYRQVLRLVYRVLFLFIAEERGLLLAPKTDAKARDRYERHYSIRRLRSLAGKRRGTRHGDQWEGLSVVMRGLGNPEGCPPIALPPLGSFLWSRNAVPDLDRARLQNADLLDAIHALSFFTDDNVRRGVDYKNLGADELGSVYESLLELHPEVHAEAARFELKSAAGHERKTTGSYYTPESLVQCLLDTALDPVLDEAARKPDAAKAILDLKVCDPACGSGHFLIAAAHRIARRLAGVPTRDEEPSPEDYRTALRDVVGHCLYGVDVNPMAVELCKVNLWIEALEPGKPLAFLEHRIQVGNSLLGTTPALMEKGIPDEAFDPIEGDDRKTASALKKRNREERKGLAAPLPFDAIAAEALGSYGSLAANVSALDSLDDQTIADIQEKEARLIRLAASPEYRRSRLTADAWCAVFVWRKEPRGPSPLTHDIYRRISKGLPDVPVDVPPEVTRLAEQYQFFHWHIAFPSVFRLPEAGKGAENRQAGWNGGFDVVLGNPPWERIKLQEQEWFTTRDPKIAQAPNAAARRKLIDALATKNIDLLRDFLEDRRQAEGASHFVRCSGRYPLCGRGDINTYAVFAETTRGLLSRVGRVGVIVPSGIATDDTTKFYFQDLMARRQLVNLHSIFEIRQFFPSTDSRVPFCLLTLGSLPRANWSDFVFDMRELTELHDVDRHFNLTSDDIALLNPNTRTCPVFRTRRDAELTKSIYRRVPILLKEGPPEENPWGVEFLAMFHMANDSHLFCTRNHLEADRWRLEGNVFRRGEDEYLPLYEAKMVRHFDHRWAAYDGMESGDVDPARKADPALAVLPRYWVPAGEVEAPLCTRWPRGWLLGWRDICRSTDERTVIASVLPRVGVGDTFLLMLPSHAEPAELGILIGNLNSFVADYAGRQKIGGTHLKYHVFKQLPILPPSTYDAPTAWATSQPLRSWLLPRVLELVYTAWDLEPFARDCGYDGPPFRWDNERRFLLRCELDAAFFHLYGISRSDVDYIMDTFPIVKRKDEKQHREYRTKRVILEFYDALAHAAAACSPYRTVLDPPPSDLRVAHPPRKTTAEL